MNTTHDQTLNEDLKRLLELSDNLRVLLNTATGEQSTRKLAQSLQQDNPMIVVVGMQSAGKSSVLERLSGIKFPRAGGMCTRAIIELRIRRGPKKDTVVRVKGPKFEQEFSSGDTAQDIMDAQEAAVSMEKSEVARKYRVEIECQDQDRPNVTMVDIPGVFNPDDESEEATAKLVKEIAQEYAEMENTIVLHVMQMNVDPAVVATKIMINSLPKGKVVTVLTKPDCLESSKPETAVLVSDYVERMHKPQFIVYGLCEGSSEEEEAYIHDLNLFNDCPDLGIGSRELASHLEELLAERLRARLPDLKSRITAELTDVNRLLSGPYADLDREKVLKQIRRGMKRMFPSKEHARCIRLCYEDMRVEVRNCHIKPISSSAVASYAPARIQDLEVGDTVFIAKHASPPPKIDSSTSKTRTSQRSEDTTFYSFRGSGQTPCTPNQVINSTQELSASTARIFSETEVQECTVKKIDGSAVVVIHDSDDEEDDEEEESVDQVLMPCLQEMLLDEIQDELDKRGCQNVEFSDTQSILEAYMSKFSDDYSSVLETIADRVLEVTLTCVKEMVQELKNTVGDCGEKVCDQIHELSTDVADSLYDDLKESFERIARYCKPPLVFTTNYHYLSQNITKLRIKSARISSDTQPNDELVKARAISELISMIEAFWKVKCKQVTECAASEIGLIFLDELGKSLEAVEDQVDELKHLVCDPLNVRLKRTDLRTQQDLLERALQLFKSL